MSERVGIVPQWWETIKGIPPFVSALIAVLAALLGATTWVAGYFATRAQLQNVKCVSDKNEDLLGFQILQIGNYSKYLKLKSEAEWLRLQKSPVDSINDKEAEALLLWRDVERSREKAEQIVRELKQGQCGNL